MSEYGTYNGREVKGCNIYEKKDGMHLDFVYVDPTIAERLKAAKQAVLRKLSATADLARVREREELARVREPHVRERGGR